MVWFFRLLVEQHESPVRDMPQIMDADRWQIPLLIKDLELRRSWIDEMTETFWFAKAGKIIGLDLINEGAVVADFDLPSDDFWYVGDGELVEFSGRDIQILQLKAIAPETEQ